MWPIYVGRARSGLIDQQLSPHVSARMGSLWRNLSKIAAHRFTRTGAARQGYRRSRMPLIRAAAMHCRGARCVAAVVIAVLKTQCSLMIKASLLSGQQRCPIRNEPKNI
jgi:hypothetical protein